MSHIIIMSDIIDKSPLRKEDFFIRFFVIDFKCERRRFDRADRHTPTKSAEFLLR